MNKRTKAKLLKWRFKRLTQRVMSPVTSIFSSDVGHVDESMFDHILSNFDEKTVFVHVGLSDIKKAFQRNPYNFLLNKLLNNFECVIAPGFTPSFRESGIYHKQFSKPQYGMFSQLFHKDADYRTDDAIHSILVKGDRRFEYCDHRDSFCESSCWAEFDRENILYLNIGTNEFITTQLHYIEVKNKLPYITIPDHDGVVYFDKKDYEQITQLNYSYKYKFPVHTRPNWRKLRKYLTSVGEIKDLSRSGLRIYAFRAREIRKALELKLETDPYYLIT